MREKLYTIPLYDAIEADTECPFCFIERSIEQDLLDLVLGSGSSYMESNIREQTDQAGFCRTHFKKMYDYGNKLGNGWILKTYYQKTIAQMEQAMKKYSPAKISFKDSLTRKHIENPVSIWAKERTESCYICNEFRSTYKRYLDTFFYLYKNDPEFSEKIKHSKGFCIPHFGDLCDYGETALSLSEKETFYPMIFSLMEENISRIYEDVSWLIEMFDYRNKDADWKNSKDAIPRAMQKMKGGFPQDPPYQQKK